MKFFFIKQKLIIIILFLFNRNQIVWFYRKFFRIFRNSKKIIVFFESNNIFEIIKIYFVNISNKKHFSNLKKTIDLDYHRILSYVYFLESPLHIKNTTFKSVLYLYWFKRFLKWLFWFIILAFYPLIYFKYIIWLFVYKHSIKYLFRFMDIIVCDILEDIIDISSYYKPVKKLFKLILLDFPFHIIPLWLSKWLSKLFSWRSWLYGITYVIFKSIDFIYYKILKIIFRKLFHVLRSLFYELKYWRYWYRRFRNFPGKLMNKIKRKFLYFIKNIKTYFFIKSKLLYFRYFFIPFYRIKVIWSIEKIKEFYKILLFSFKEPKKIYYFFKTIKHNLFFRIYIILFVKDKKNRLCFIKTIYPIRHNLFFVKANMIKNINYIVNIFYQKYFLCLDNILDFCLNYEQYNLYKNFFFNSESYDKSLDSYQEKLWFEIRLNNISSKNPKNNQSFIINK